MPNTVFELNSRTAGALAPVSRSLRARNERIVINFCGDSTARKASIYANTSYQYGWPTGFSKAMQRFGIPMCATGIYGPDPASGSGFYCPGGYGQEAAMRNEAVSEAIGIAAWANLLSIGAPGGNAGMEHLRGWSRTSALTYSGSGGNTAYGGLLLNGSDSCNTAAISADHSPMTLFGPLDAHYLHGNDPTGGSFPVEVFAAGGSVAGYGSGTINCASPTESYGITGRTKISIVAGTAQYNDLHFSFKRRAAAITPGSGILKLGMVIEDPARTWGYSLHPLYQLGSKTYSDCMDCLEASHADWQDAYFTFQRRFATGSPKKIVCLDVFGFNDTSAGGGLNTAAVYKANFLRRRAWMYGIWDRNGWDRGELFFCPTPSWQQSDPDDSDIITYRTAVRELEQEYAQVQSLDPMRVLDWDVTKHLFDANATTQDLLHISRQGEDVMGHAMVSQLIGGEWLHDAGRMRQR